MHFTRVLSLALAAAQPGLTHPGMKKVLSEIREISKRSTMPTDSTELIGDLATLSDGELTATGALIKSIILNQADPESYEANTVSADISSAECKEDTCCIWSHIADEMHALFTSPSGRCTKWARFAIRLGFHDAGSWDKSSPNGGADGSIVLAPEERARGENGGLVAMIEQTQAWYTKYHDDMGYDSVTMADLIQLGANVATVTCPLGPRVRTFVGRKDSSLPAPTGLLPSPFASAESLIQLFADKTIGSRGLVALVGAHTTSQQTTVDPQRALDPQDSTPGVWDTLYYGQTLSQNPPPRVFRFQSDLNLAAHEQTSGDFQAFAGRNGQALWNRDYAREYVRLSLLGVNNINDLQECTKVLPQPIRGNSRPRPSSGNSPAASTRPKSGATDSNFGPDSISSPSNLEWTPPDQAQVDKWLQTVGRSGSNNNVGQMLAAGQTVTNL
ncbi:Peroxidase [Ceratocystis fimbriata CBS 114723]|uniref:Peroxidase n=1 Tax=Ceratocystis fimbriata CBS 114723 TaxID=1035309 RepID=A0A2C5WZJ2_9PEZI|nr:Peroxidase [Ceratocystis fimbriata CBS 114723]